MLEVNVLIERVDAARLSDKASENSPSNYSVNVSMSERDRNPQALILVFALELTDQPQLARLAVSGVATLTGTKDEIQAALEAPEDKTPPPVLTTIYERIYGLLYLVTGSLKVPHPLPTMLKASGTEK
ncbi:MAG: hypothetical protein ABSB26_05160 [Nitrososphaerales archaeon]|jgi:hypothetical protein